ncbi:hypothetical protein HGRIS_012059 [Hohenbuehelia grisea]|uniref:Uncharacterized protein n=1 Tax=Hohenbuehelia grisea TaxID=104357 RepID=A0ABR3IR42_9AGAR
MLTFIYLYQIVPSAAFHLFRAIKTWTNLQHLHLTNIAFPPNAHETCFANLTTPSLRTIYIGQSTFLSPQCIAALCIAKHEALEFIHLVDAYQESIWGPRLRRSDVESHILESSGLGDPIEAVELVSVVRKWVLCEARTERTMGGDRADGEVIPAVVN